MTIGENELKKYSEKMKYFRLYDIIAMNFKKNQELKNK